jgi:hypothetical protein
VGIIIPLNRELSKLAGERLTSQNFLALFRGIKDHRVKSLA